MSSHSILIAEDDAATRERLRSVLIKAGFEVVVAENGRRALELVGRERIDLVLSDHRMPGMTGLELLRVIGGSSEIPMILYSAGADSEVVFQSGQLGAARFLEYPFRVDDQLLPAIARALDDQKGGGDGARSGVGRLLGESPQIQRVRELVHRVAKSNSTVLITGETGTGKDVVARAIHDESGRESYFAVAVPELAEGLLESELFGHEKGAFTGAAGSRQGLFEACSNGTLFLDEIGDAPGSVQAKLLRVIETGEVRPVGGNRFTQVEVRLLVATHRDLASSEASGEFRKDLFYRLRQLEIHIPPLRERPDDVDVLARFFLSDLATQAQLPIPSMSSAFVDSLRAQPWPGNARELRAAMQRILLWWDGESVLEPLHTVEAVDPSALNLTPDERLERQQMLEVFRGCARNQEAARRELQMSRAAWRHRWARYGLQVLGRGSR